MPQFCPMTNRVKKNFFFQYRHFLKKFYNTGNHQSIQIFIITYLYMHRERKKSQVCITVWAKILKKNTINFHNRQENLKKSRQKNSWSQINHKIFFRDIAFLAVLNFFPVQKLAIFEIAKNGIWSKKLLFVKLIYLISRVFLA